MDKILVLDISGQGVTLDNLWSGPGIPLGGSIFMMAIDIMLYAGLAYYFDSVIPSKFDQFFTGKLFFNFILSDQVIMEQNVRRFFVLVENFGVTTKRLKFHC